VEPSKVAAEFKDGLLKVQIAKSEKALPKTIDVKVS
jgi:HSP20 family molecular chaperone IbpA